MSQPQPVYPTQPPPPAAPSYPPGYPAPGYPSSYAYPYPTAEARRRSPWLIRIPLLTLGGIFLLGTFMIVFMAIHLLQYDSLIYPGVSVYGVPLGGMTRTQAIDQLGKRFTYGSQAIFTFRDGTNVWEKSASELGVRFDPVAAAEQAYEVGRGDGLIGNAINQLRTWSSGVGIAPTIVYDQSQASGFLSQIAGQINQSAQDATIAINGSTVSASDGHAGRTLDIPATLGTLRQVITGMSTGAEIPLVIQVTPPNIANDDQVAAQVRAALASPIQFYDPTATGSNTTPAGWSLSPDFIAKLITIQRVPDSTNTAQHITTAHYEVKVTLDTVKQMLQGLGDSLKVDPADARFLFDDVTNQIHATKDSVAGRSLDVDATLKAVQDALFKADGRKIPLAFRVVNPTVNSQATAQQLGITELISTATTHFYGSTANRRANIKVAASQFQGLVIAPGEHFSFDKHLGDVSAEQGYQDGLVIVGNQTITGVGGGVCQVSTTMFQTAFYAGFPIDIRYPHGYRVGYYESGTATANGHSYTSGAGLDATVYSPQVDMVFTNDTPYHILIEEVFDDGAQSLTFKFYSTSMGRVVTVTSPVVGNYVAHGATVYQNSTDIPAGTTQQVDYAVDGADIHVYRTVTQNGQVIINHEDIFSHYLPWHAVFLVGSSHS